MIWSFLFAIGLVQGCFLSLVFAMRNNGNRPATRLLQVLLVLFALSNFDDLLLSTGWYKVVPGLFGYSLGAMFAYGPLFYLYIVAVTNPGFRWKRTTGLHFLPALLNLLLNLPWLVLPAAGKTRILADFLAGQMPVRLFNVALFTAQILHFVLYLWLAYRAVRRVQRLPEAVSFHVPLHSRVAWLYTLLILFSLILLALVGLFGWNFFAGHFVANANFVFTLVTSAILYSIAYKLILQPELVTPGFSKKYQTLRFGAGEEQDLLLQLNRFVEEEKGFTDPELNLSRLAAQVKVSPHRLSMLINDKYGVSFSDFINRYRVEEFIARLNDPHYAHYTFYGLALEVGFNSKSTFNAAFKKITGKPPSAFKRVTNNAR